MRTCSLKILRPLTAASPGYLYPQSLWEAVVYKCEVDADDSASAFECLNGEGYKGCVCTQCSGTSDCHGHDARRHCVGDFRCSETCGSGADGVRSSIVTRPVCECIVRPARNTSRDDLHLPWRRVTTCHNREVTMEEPVPMRPRAVGRPVRLHEATTQVRSRNLTGSRTHQRDTFRSSERVDGGPSSARCTPVPQ
jgi:hypothetical protein